MVLSASACSKDAPPVSPEPTNPITAPAPGVQTAPPVIGDVKPAITANIDPTDKPTEPEPAEPLPDEPVPAEPEPVEPTEPIAAVEPTPTEPEPDSVEPAEPTDQPPGDDDSTAPGIKMHDVQLADAAITNEIIDRLPAERRDTWVIGQDPSLLIWMEFENKIGEVTLESVWKRDGEERWRFPFQVGKSPHWRTWVTKRIGNRDAGAWTVDIVDEGGFVYHHSTFTIAAE